MVTFDCADPLRLAQWWAEQFDGEVDRLKSAGAAEVERHSIGDSFRWVVLADPEGNTFCVAGAG